MSGPFEGVTVVEFGQFVVVPFCSQLMADGGARVIKVEPPSGDSYRSWSDGIGESESRQFLIKNRGKESFSLDLSHARAAEVVAALVRSADVVLVNLSPAAVARRGLDYESLRRVNPRIVYGAATAYGQVGPEAHLPGMDVVVQARSGLLSSLGAEHDGIPLHSEVQAADYSSSLLLLAGISAALYARERNGTGQRVDVSLLAGALAMQNNSLGHVHEHDSWRTEFVQERLPALRQANATRETVEAERRRMRPDPPSHTAHYRVFRTVNGFLAIGAGSPAARGRLCPVVGLAPDLADSDPEAFGAALEQALRERTSDEWSKLLADADVPVATVRHIDEILFDDHVLAEGLVADYDHPEVGRYRALGIPIRMSGTPMESSGPSPTFAADTVRVLSEIGYGSDDIDQLASSGVVVASPARSGSTTKRRST
jgi:crotonobetainyl-CoA:carnitine CoA-transferase CaiB-like acyl-CoA transferase